MTERGRVDGGGAVMDIRALTLVTIGVTIVLTGCAVDNRDASGSTAAPDSTATPESTGTPTPTEVSGVIDIGGGRELSLECQGNGAPTVILISGTGGAADEWMVVADNAEPSGPPTASPESVFDTIALTTRVCAYDRPGTTLASGEPSPSTIVEQPTSALDGANDLRALLANSGETGPYVVVGASWGGLIAQMFAREHPESVEGIALVDSASSALKDTLTTEQWDAWMQVIAATNTGSGAEVPDYESSLAELAAAPLMPAIPAVVLSSDQEWDLAVTPGMSTWPAWLEAQDALAGSLHAAHISKTSSGHGIHVEQPALVTEAVLDLVDEARK